MYTLGIDLGSSSVKVCIFDVEKGKTVGSAFYPHQEMEISSPMPGWAEQSPEVWWQNFQHASQLAFRAADVSPNLVTAIGISYQMHGLVMVDDSHQVLRPSIIWCDSRAVPFGEEAFNNLGQRYCMDHMLNSPGNFTAAKLAWVKKNEPKIFEKVHKFMLPGDYLALKLTGEINTTASGLSEGIMWDFKAGDVAFDLLKYYDFDEDIVADIVGAFAEQSSVSKTASDLLGIPKGTPVTYRAGDQPNNAFSLNVLNPGEVAATAGTSGVIYVVTDQDAHDEESRINTFLHVNDKKELKRNGLLLCVNGTGSLNSWIKSNIALGDSTYEELNMQASNIPIGAEGIRIYPFGNGAERLLNNQDLGGEFLGLSFSRHQRKHLYRAAQEGIVFALRYGFDLLEDLGAGSQTIRAGKANMFLSPIFREAFSNTVGATVELYDTNGAEGAARGAALGGRLYDSEAQAFEQLACLETTMPDPRLIEQYEEAYQFWKEGLESRLSR
ncbi:MAG: carbohydrate kinase [Cyclobacteriaceae bacterium]|nr:carbohydrate kinase [Cyclobacteriaceae bacterium HetDA_MAG_MS6]